MSEIVPLTELSTRNGGTNKWGVFLTQIKEAGGIGTDNAQPRGIPLQKTCCIGRSLNFKRNICAVANVR